MLPAYHSYVTVVRHNNILPGVRIGEEYRSGAGAHAVQRATSLTSDTTLA